MPSSARCEQRTNANAGKSIINNSGWVKNKEDIQGNWNLKCGTRIESDNKDLKITRNSFFGSCSVITRI